MGDADYILAFQKIIMPIALEFSPELVMSQPYLSDRQHSYSIPVLQFRQGSTRQKAMT